MYRNTLSKTAAAMLLVILCFCSLFPSTADARFDVDSALTDGDPDEYGLINGDPDDFGSRTPGFFATIVSSIVSIGHLFRGFRGILL